MQSLSPANYEKIETWAKIISNNYNWTKPDQKLLLKVMNIKQDLNNKRYVANSSRSSKKTA